jgi:putative FmdB family regulatory protein
MPIYEYACEACGHRVEQMQRMSDPPLVTCPSCAADAMKRLISQTSFVLKGSGWYKTDYAAKPAAGGSSSSSGESSAGGGESKSDSSSSSSSSSDAKPSSSETKPAKAAD